MRLSVLSRFLYFFFYNFFFCPIIINRRREFRSRNEIRFRRRRTCLPFERQCIPWVSACLLSFERRVEQMAKHGDVACSVHPRTDCRNRMPGLKMRQVVVVSSRHSFHSQNELREESQV